MTGSGKQTSSKMKKLDVPTNYHQLCLPVFVHVLSSGGDPISTHPLRPDTVGISSSILVD